MAIFKTVGVVLGFLVATVGGANLAHAISLPDGGSCNVSGTYCLGVSNSNASGWGIAGYSSGTGPAIVGQSSKGSGVSGASTSATAGGTGVRGSSAGSGAGVWGSANGSGNGVMGTTNNSASAIYGESNGPSGFGVAGRVPASSTGIAVYGDGHHSATAWAGFFDGDVGASSFVTFSDARLKKDIKNLSYGLDDLLKMRAVSYRFKSGENDRVQLGLIAQEVQAIVPEMVRTDARSGMLTVNYTALIPVMIRSFQEQQAIIQAQERRIARLEKQAQPQANASFLGGGSLQDAFVLMALALSALGLVGGRFRRSHEASPPSEVS